MREGTSIDRAAAVYFETLAQIESFEPARFREFYSTLGVNPSDAAAYSEQVRGADAMAAHARSTDGAYEIATVFFGDPNDELVALNGNLTVTAQRVLDRARRCRESVVFPFHDADDHHGPWRDPYLDTVKFTVYIGRRHLGSERFHAFEKHAEDLSSLHRSARFKGAPPTIRSYDGFIDRAAGAVVSPYPMLNQPLLKDILQRIPAVRKLALSRLDQTPENRSIFEHYLDDPALVWEAASGIFDIEVLRKTHARAGEIDRTLLEIRIASLEQDQETLKRIALSSKNPEWRNLAILNMANREALATIRGEKFWDGRAERETREHLVDARLGLLDGNLEQLHRLLDERNVSERVRLELRKILRRIVAEPYHAPEVFISYKHESDEHRAWAKNLAADLRANGVNALLDEWELSLGESISDFATRAIAKADAMLFVITEEAVAAVEADERTRSVLKFEFQIANARRYRDGNFNIIGILRSGDRPPNHIADTLYLDFRNDVKYQTQLAVLVNGLHERTQRPPLATRPL